MNESNGRIWTERILITVLAATAGALVSITGAGIHYGSTERQVEIDSKRLDLLEQQVRITEGTIEAMNEHFKYIDQRLTREENERERRK